MSDPKAAELKPEAAPPSSKPAEVKAAPAAAPAPAAATAAPAAPAAKPAEAAKPAAAAAKAEPKPAAPELPKPGTVGVRAPAPTPPSNGVNITITAKHAIYAVSALAVLVLMMGGVTIFLLVRTFDPKLVVRYEGPGGEGSGYNGGKKAGGDPGHAGAVAAAEKPPEPVAKVEIGAGFKENLGGKPGETPGAWPHFRGPKYDNTVTGVALANKWPAAGPPLKWSLSLGEGYSGPAVLGGRIYIQDYNAKTLEESLRCFSLDDGKEIWQRSHTVKINNNHGFTRTVPAVTDKYAVMIGSMCHVLCVDSQTGAMKWGIDLCKDYGTVNPNWYTAQCPVIDGNQVILAPAGKDVLMMGVDLETGKVAWQTPNPKKLTMSHSSISIMTLLGKKMYVYCGEWGKMVGVSAEPADVGTQLWEVTCLDQQTMSPAPVAIDDSRIFMTSGVRAGSALVKVSKDGDKFSAATEYRLDFETDFSTEQQTPILYNKHLFALMPDASSVNKSQFACMDPFDKGKFVWKSGKTKRFGQWEAVLLADGKFFVLDKDSRLTLVKASTQKYEELAQCKLLQGHEAWAPMVLVGSRLLLRDSKQMICLEVGKGIE